MMVSVAENRMPTEAMSGAHQSRRKALMGMPLSSAHNGFRDLDDQQFFADVYDHVGPEVLEDLRGVILRSRVEHRAYDATELVSRTYECLMAMLRSNSHEVRRSCFAFIVFIRTRLDTNNLDLWHDRARNLDAASTTKRHIREADHFLANECFKLTNVYEKHWNAAAVWRMLWKNYSLLKKCRMIWAEGGRRCRHKRNFRLLEQVLALAQAETRRACEVAAGSNPDVPVEIVDMIYEYTLLAEGIPVEKTTWYEERPGRESDIDSESGFYDSDAQLPYPAPRNTKFLYKKYRCKNMKKPPRT